MYLTSKRNKTILSLAEIHALCMLLLLNFFTLYQLQGQTKSSTKARSLLQQTVDQYELAETTGLKLLIRAYNSLTNEQMSSISAEIFFDKKKYHLFFEGNEQIYDGQKVYYILHEDEEVTINTASDSITGETINMLPSKMISDVLDQSKYTLLWDIKQITPHGTVQYIKALPKDKKSEIESMLVGVRTPSYTLHSIYQETKKHQQIHIEVRDVLDPTTYPTLFVFNRSSYAHYYIQEI